eukprot:scaffold6811_cov92-Skeletonema_marinoi.AAC.1
MAPYSLSACQVVRVFCAVMRALGASPIMSLRICARPLPPLFLRATSLLKDLFEVFSSSAPTHNTKHHGEMACSVRLKGNRRELISAQHVYLDPIATAQRVICGDFNVSS